MTILVIILVVAATLIILSLALRHLGIFITPVSWEFEVFPVGSRKPRTNARWARALAKLTRNGRNGSTLLVEVGDSNTGVELRRRGSDMVGTLYVLNADRNLAEAFWIAEGLEPYEEESTIGCIVGDLASVSANLPTTFCGTALISRALRVVYRNPDNLTVSYVR